MMISRSAIRQMPAIALAVSGDDLGRRLLHGGRIEGQHLRDRVNEHADVCVAVADDEDTSIGLVF